MNCGIHIDCGLAMHMVPGLTVFQKQTWPRYSPCREIWQIQCMHTVIVYQTPFFLPVGNPKEIVGTQFQPSFFIIIKVQQLQHYIYRDGCYSLFWKWLEGKTNKQDGQPLQTWGVRRGGSESVADSFQEPNPWKREHRPTQDGEYHIPNERGIIVRWLTIVKISVR